MIYIWQFERTVHWAVWTGSCVYSLYCFCNASLSYRNQLYSGDFGPGWSIVGTEQDVSDFEWAAIKAVWKEQWCLFVGQCLISVILKEFRFPRSIVLCGMIASSFYSILVLLGFKSLFIYIGNVLLCLIAVQFGCKPIAYGTPFAVIILQSVYSLYQNEQATLDDAFVQSFLFDIGLGWLNMKCVSFSMDRIDFKRNTSCFDEFICFMAYCFYLPCFFTGPIILYNSFDDQLKNLKRSSLFTDPVRILFTFLKYVIYYYFMELILHFCYTTSFQFYPSLANELETWPLSGLGYALPCVFYVKYILLYGFAGLLSEIQSVILPPPPKCVSRGHLSSFLWKHFDRGLYLWIIRYLYFPLVGQSKNLLRRIISSSVCFAFMAVWHGMHFSIISWSLLNYAGVALEMIGAALGTKILDCTNWKPSAICYQRLQALAGAPFFMHMCITNIFFLSNYEIGKLFWKKIVFGFPIPLLTTLFIMYCGSHVSIEVNRWEQNKAAKNKTKKC